MLRPVPISNHKSGDVHIIRYSRCFWLDQFLVSKILRKTRGSWPHQEPCSPKIHHFTTFAGLLKTTVPGCAFFIWMKKQMTSILHLILRDRELCMDVLWLSFIPSYDMIWCQDWCDWGTSDLRNKVGQILQTGHCDGLHGSVWASLWGGCDPLCGHNISSWWSDTDDINATDGECGCDMIMKVFPLFLTFSIN